MAGGLTRPHNAELHNLYVSTDITRVIKPKKMRWAGHVAWERYEIRNLYSILVGKSEGKSPLEDLGIDDRIILEWILGKYCEKVRTGYIWLRIETGGGLL
jgi:hypothetical protein